MGKFEVAERLRLGQVRKNSLKVDGGNYMPSHTLYRSKGEYAERIERNRLWRPIHDATPAFAPPSRLTTETLRAILQHLNGE